MKKKGLILLVCLALVSTLAVNGTFATELGNIFKDLTEWLGENLGKPATDANTLDVKLVSESTGILAPSHYAEDIFSWDKASGIVEHETHVENLKDESAYVRICIAVRKMEGILYARVQLAEDFTAFPTKNQKLPIVTIQGKEFYLYTFDYNAAVTKEKPSSTIEMAFALDKNTTNEDIVDLGEDFIQVQSFAIQADVFKKTENGEEKQMSATEALTEALGSINEFNPYGN